MKIRGIRVIVSVLGVLGLIAGSLGCGSAAEVTKTTEASTPVFVLVHGGAHGGWAWQRLTPLLRDAGYEVYTPTLTGLGERAHLLTPQAGLNTHIQDILNVLKYEDLHNVILVGHSYGGTVVKGVSQQAPERLAQIVYLDAVIPDDDKSVVDMFPPGAVDSLRKDWHTAFPPPETYGLTDSADLEWVSARLGEQAWTTFTEPLGKTNNISAAIPRIFIRLGDPHLTPLLDQFADKAKALGWAYYDWGPAAHDIMVTDPRRLADKLIDIAKKTK